MFEVDYPNHDMAKEALRLAMHKLPIKCKIVGREEKTTKLGENNGNASN